MRYAKGANDGIIDALTIQTVSERREAEYYCPECNTAVTFVWSHLGNRHFRHRQGHKPCILSSLTGSRNIRKWPWQVFLKVRQRLTDYLTTESSIVQVSPLQWATEDSRLALIPFYTPERYLIQLHEKIKTQDLWLVLLLPKILTTQDYADIQRYGTYRLKVRAVYSYAYLYSIPRRLILTNGTQFYHLTNENLRA